MGTFSVLCCGLNLSPVARGVSATACAPTCVALRADLPYLTLPYPALESTASSISISIDHLVLQSPSNWETPAASLSHDQARLHRLDHQHVQAVECTSPVIQCSARNSWASVEHRILASLDRPLTYSLLQQKLEWYSNRLSFALLSLGGKMA